jgi:hypothetical protein
VKEALEGLCSEINSRIEYLQECSLRWAQSGSMVGEQITDARLAELISVQFKLRAILASEAQP